MTIVIVEDNIYFRKALQTLIRAHFPSADIRWAENSEQAVETIWSAPPDLIFMDIRIPGESGLKLTGKIKAAHPDAVVVINTSYDLPEYRKAAHDMGADHFISKHALGESETRQLVGRIRQQLQNT